MFGTALDVSVVFRFRNNAEVGNRSMSFITDIFLAVPIYLSTGALCPRQGGALWPLNRKSAA